MKHVIPSALAAAVLSASLLGLSGCANTGTGTEASGDPCQVGKWTAADLYGTWTVDLPDRQEHGTMVLSPHPDYPGSLRAHINYAGIHALGSGDIQDGILNLDESRDGKNISGYWDGALDAATCGSTIRGTWDQVVPEGAAPVQTPFVLQRVRTRGGF